jgi:hypothetical protein
MADHLKRLGGHGSHPDTLAAVARVVEAHQRRDMDGVRRACGEVVEAARRVAGAVSQPVP